LGSIFLYTKIPNLPDNSNYLGYCSVDFALKQPEVVGKSKSFDIGVMKDEMVLISPVQEWCKKPSVLGFQ